MFQSKEELFAPPRHGLRSPTVQVAIAFLVLLFFVVLLRLRKFPGLHWVVQRWPTRRRHGSSRMVAPEEIVAALDCALVWLPVRPLCLAYSAALVILLRSHAFAAELVIGVTNRPFGGHAWVESQGQIVGPSAYTDSCVVLDRF